MFQFCREGNQARIWTPICLALNFTLFPPYFTVSSKNCKGSHVYSSTKKGPVPLQSKAGHESKTPRLTQKNNADSGCHCFTQSWHSETTFSSTSTPRTFYIELQAYKFVFGWIISFGSLSTWGEKQFENAFTRFSGVLFFSSNFLSWQKRK